MQLSRRTTAAWCVVVCLLGPLRAAGLHAQVPSATAALQRHGVQLDSAGLAAVAAWQVSRQDVNDHLTCRAGSCSSKLPAAEMQRLQDSVDWRSDDRQGRARGARSGRELTSTGRIGRN